MGVKTETMTEHDLKILYSVAEVAEKARRRGNHPFGAVLTGPDGSVLMTAENTVTTEHNDCGHAETNLMIAASKRYEREFLADCTLYTTVEPCVMCSGAIYWGNVRRVVYGLSEHRLLEMTGGNPENPTFSLPCREVFSRGQKDITVIGPTEDEQLEQNIAEGHRGFWN